MSPSVWSRPMTWERRGGRTPSNSPRWAGVNQGHAVSRSRTRFSAGLRRAGSRWSGAEVTMPPGGRSAGIDARRRCPSAGSAFPGFVFESAVRRLSAASPDGVCQTCPCAAGDAASRSRARNAGTGKPFSSLRACCRREPSDASTRSAPGSRPSYSRRSRLEKAVLSAVGPCRTMPTLRPPGNMRTASSAVARNHLNPSREPRSAATAAARR